MNLQGTRPSISKLHCFLGTQDGFISEKTRVIFLEFTIYNFNLGVWSKIFETFRWIDLFMMFTFKGVLCVWVIEVAFSLLGIEGKQTDHLWF